MKTLLALLLLITTLSWGDKVFLNCKCQESTDYPSYKSEQCNYNWSLTLNFDEPFHNSDSKYDYLMINDNQWGLFTSTAEYYFSDDWVKHTNPMSINVDKNTCMWRLNRINGEFDKVCRYVQHGENWAYKQKFQCEKTKQKF